MCVNERISHRFGMECLSLQHRLFSGSVWHAWLFLLSVCVGIYPLFRDVCDLEIGEKTPSRVGV